MKRVVYHCHKCQISKQALLTEAFYKDLMPFVADSYICGNCGQKILVGIVEIERDEKKCSLTS